MTPYQPGQNIFQTGADERFNSFTDPSALAFNQSRGNWGVNPNLLTPSYTAAYRPTYNGAQGNPFGGPTPSFGQSFNQIVNPFASGGVNYGGNTNQQQSPYYDAVVYNPLDTSANIAQKWVVPGFASWLSYKYLSKPMGEIGKRATAGFVTGVASGTFSAGRVATMASVAGGVGGFAASMIGPQMIGAAAAHLVDKAVFDPYVAQRQISNSLRQNFGGISFADGSGDRDSGRGFSRASSSRIASSLSNLASKDLSFNQSEVANLTDLSARSGLLDTVQGGQIADRMKAIVRQVKTVMQVGNTSDFKEAVEIMAKMQASGVAAKDISAVTNRLGNAASSAGVSLQKMMATVGAQGEYLFASNGLSPFAGQLTAANSYAGFSSAQRSGLLSNALLARMGGVEGATQSHTAGLLAMAQTPYASFAAANKYMGGGDTGNVVGNVSKFGGRMAMDVVGGYGGFEYNREELASKSLTEEGHKGQMQQIIEMSKNMGWSPNGAPLDARKAFVLMTQAMGLTKDQARTVIETQRLRQDVGATHGRIAGIHTAHQAMLDKSLEDGGFTKGIASAPLKWASYQASEMQSTTGGIVGNMLEGVGEMTDNLKSFSRKAFGYKDVLPEKDTLDFAIDYSSASDSALVKELGFTSKIGWFTDTTPSDISDAAKKLQGNSALLKILNDSTKDDNAKLSSITSVIANAASSGTIDSNFKKADSRDKLAKFILKKGIKKGKSSSEMSVKDAMGALSEAAGQDMVALINDTLSSGEVAEGTAARITRDTGVTFKDPNDVDEVKRYLTHRAANVSGTDAEGLTERDFANKAEAMSSTLQSRKAIEDEKNGLANTLDFSKLDITSAQMTVSGPLTINYNGPPPSTSWVDKILPGKSNEDLVKSRGSAK